MASSSARSILPTVSAFCPRSFQSLTDSGRVPAGFTAEEKTVLQWIDRGIPYRQIERVLGVGRMTVAAIAGKAGRTPRKLREREATRKIDGTIARMIGKGMGPNQIAASLKLTRQAISRHLIGMGIRSDLDKTEEQRLRMQAESVAFMISRRVPVKQIAKKEGMSSDTVRKMIRSLGVDTGNYDAMRRKSRVELQAPRMLLAAELVPRTWTSVLAQAGLNANTFAAYKAKPRDFKGRLGALAKALGVEEGWLQGEGAPTLRGINLDDLPGRRARACERIREAVTRSGRTIKQISASSGIRASMIGALMTGPRLRPYAYIMPLALELRCPPGWLSGDG